MPNVAAWERPTCNSLFTETYGHRHRERCTANNNTRLTIWLQSSVLRAAFWSKSATIGLVRHGTIVVSRCFGAIGCIDQAMSTTHKKVIVRKMDRDTVNGYVGCRSTSPTASWNC